MRPSGPSVLRFFIFVFASAVPAAAAIVDTVVVSDGGPGPYCIGRSFIDSSSIRISSRDSLRYPVPAFTFIDEINAVLFSEPVDSGVVFGVRFTTRRFGLPKTYALFEKSYAGVHDIVMRPSDTAAPANRGAFANENLVVTGYKSIGISVNNFGSANLEQGLDVSLSGTIAPKTTLSGHLTDQGSSLEGTTREMSDVDMVYVALDNPRYHAVVGDQYAQWLANGMFSGRKKIKGIAAGASVRGVSIDGFGALSSGSAIVQTMTGKNGLQGPYRLLGKGEEGFIMPIHGTVHVSIGEKKYQEGADNDFIVDYEQGSITFTPKVFVKDEDIIRVEYEYRLFDYQRTFTGTSLVAAASDSSIVVRGALWRETDDKGRPLDMTLSPEDIRRLGAAGDVADLTTRGRPVDPKDVAWQSSQQPLYVRDSASGEVHFKFKPFNPADPLDNQGFYFVSFRNAGTGKGDYELDSDSMRAHPTLGAIYKHADPGPGDWALAPLPLPQSKVLGEIRSEAKIGSLASLKLDVAGMDLDRNLFSSIQDDNNRGAAVDGSLLFGEKRIDRKSLWLGGAYSHVTPNMTQEVSSAFNRYQQWDDTSGRTQTGRRQSWESFAGAALSAGSSIEGTYGRYLHNSRLITDRLTGALQASFFKKLALSYDAGFFRHWTTDTTKETTRRGNGRVSLAVPKIECSLEYKDEWRSSAAALNRGMAGAGASIRVAPLLLRESVFYSSYRRGASGLLSAQDTGYSLLWDQEMDRSFSSSWKANLSGHYFRQHINKGASNTSVLIVAKNEVQLPARGFSTQQKYQVSIEKASSFIQVPVPVGKGLGDHAWDTTLREYMPAKNGDYIIREQEIINSQSDNRLRKALLSISWSLRGPLKRFSGFLANANFEGGLQVDEQLASSPLLRRTSWLPGYASLFEKNSAIDSLIRFADISYRQSVDWPADSLRGLHGSLFLQPTFKKIRDYSETGNEWGGALDRLRGRLELNAEVKFLSVTRRGTSYENNYGVVDRHFQGTEKWAFFRDFSLSMKETGGWAAKTSEKYDNNGWYSRLSPGIEWRPGTKGLATVSYTWSSVDINGIIDYRMAQGFSSGVTHSIDCAAHIKWGEHFTTDISYRGEFGKSVGSGSGLHVMSMQMKAFL